jgi:hypothetical protein
MTDTGASMGGRKNFTGAGGTPGGVGEFLVGLVMFAVGIYVLFDRITVQTGFWNLFGGRNTFGLTMIPVLLGIGLLFFNGRSIVGWLMTGGGLLFIVVGVIVNLDFYFQRTTLWGALIIFGLPMAGLGLMARGLRPHRSKQAVD